jgi:hypothetical protein
MDGLLFVKVLVKALSVFAFKDLSNCHSDIIVLASKIVHSVCSSSLSERTIIICIFAQMVSFNCDTVSSCTHA